MLRNLLQNAVRSTARGGLVLIRARAHATSVSVEIQDTGPGIDRAVLEQLATAACAPAGEHGHGLYLVRELIESMGGRMAVHSAAGEGTCFVLRFALPPGNLTTPTRPRQWRLTRREGAPTRAARALPG